MPEVQNNETAAKSQNPVRDNFTEKTKTLLATRAHYLCSNPECRRQTYWPCRGQSKAFKTGIAAHITAAAGRGPRRDDSLSQDDRKSIDNAIWLCVECATKIDRDPVAYPTELLKKWKQDHEALVASGFTVVTESDESSHNLVRLVIREFGKLFAEKGDASRSADMQREASPQDFIESVLIEPERVSHQPNFVQTVISQPEVTLTEGVGPVFIQCEANPSDAFEPSVTQLAAEPPQLESKADASPLGSASTHGAHPNDGKARLSTTEPIQNRRFNQSIPSIEVVGGDVTLPVAISEPPKVQLEEPIQANDQKLPPLNDAQRNRAEVSTRPVCPPSPVIPTSNAANRGHSAARGANRTSTKKKVSPARRPVSGIQAILISRVTQSVLAGMILICVGVAGKQLLEPGLPEARNSIDTPSDGPILPASLSSSSKESESSTKVVCLVGQVARPGSYELDSASITCQQLIERIGGTSNRFSGQFQLIREGQLSRSFDRTTARTLLLKNGDLIIAESSSAIQTNGETQADTKFVQVGFVGLIDRPIVVKMAAECATVAKIVGFLNQDRSVASKVKFIVPSAQQSSRTPTIDSPLDSETVLLFPTNLIAKDRLPNNLPTTIKLAEPRPSAIPSLLKPEGRVTNATRSLPKQS